MYIKSDQFNKAKIKRELRLRNEKACDLFKINFEKMFGRTFTNRSHKIKVIGTV